MNIKKDSYNNNIVDSYYDELLEEKMNPPKDEPDIYETARAQATSDYPELDESNTFIDALYMHKYDEDIAEMMANLGKPKEEAHSKYDYKKVKSIREAKKLIK